MRKNDSPAAVQLAFSDVQRAFRHYLATENKGRPFIIAAHSQGARLAIELLQTDIFKTPIKKRLLAAYVIGAWVSERFAEEDCRFALTQRRPAACLLEHKPGRTDGGLHADPRQGPLVARGRAPFGSRPRRLRQSLDLDAVRRRVGRRQSGQPGETLELWSFGAERSAPTRPTV